MSQKLFSPPTDFFSGSNPLDSDPDSHVITTEHYWMRELGLSVFTTGTLATWWNKEDERGDKVNQELIGRATLTSVVGSPGQESPLTFSAWRKGVTNPKAGAYTQFRLTEVDNPAQPPGREIKKWDYVQDGINYQLTDASLNDFNQQVVLGWDEGGKTSHKKPVYQIDGEQQFSLDYDMGEVTKLVALNDHVRHINLQEPDFNILSKKDKVRVELITDIKASKEGHVSWSGLIPFRFGLADGTFQCNKSEWVEFKLYLFDESTPRNSSRTAAFAQTKIVAPPKDILGRAYAKHQDGTTTSTRGSSPIDQVVADMDLTYNQYTNKWESGSTQMLGKVVTEIKAADIGTDVTQWEEEDIKAALDDPNRDDVPFETGSVMPITMQNGNPMQWSPNYAKSEDCRKDEKKKATVMACNFDSHKSFPKNKLVMLNKVQGVWIPMDFGSGIDIASRPSTFDGIWDFTYFATNSEYYFRTHNHILNTSDPYGAITFPEEKEKEFHRRYYRGDPLNEDNYGTDVNTQAIKNVYHGYHQFSSFDFMDHYMGGTRGKMRSLAGTQYRTKPDGSRTSDEECSFRTFPFFGCVFPDGYSDNKLNTYYTENRQTDSDLGFIESEGEEKLQFFDTSVINNDTALYPFSEGANGINLTKDDGSCTLNIPYGSIRSANMASHATALDDNTQFCDGLLDCQMPMFLAVGQDPKNPLSTRAAHLPADIGTLASPNEENPNGRPISSLKWLKTLDNETGSTVQTACREYFDKAYNWLSAHHKDSSKDSSKSAFNFKPASPNVIEFRPLNWETYAQFDDFDMNGTKQGIANEHGIFQPSVDARGGAPGFKPYDWPQSRMMVSVYGQRMMADGLPVASTKSRDREKTLFSQANPLYRPSIPLPYEKRQAISNSDTDDSYRPTGLKYSTDIDKKFIEGGRERFDSEVWQQYWMNAVGSPGFGGETHRNGGANAVGVIAATCTVSADRKIMFETSNYLGQRAYQSSKTVDTGGIGWHLGNWGLTGQSILKKEKVTTVSWHPTWGGSQMSYKDLNTTDLSVRIYHAWPRNQTIYDSRFFAVYHFNDGIDVPITDVETEKGPVVLHDGTTKEIDIQKQLTSVDLRRPTRETGECGDNNRISHDCLIYSDGGGGILDGENPLTYLGKKENWCVDGQRRGKLLPYNYEVETIGVSHISQDQSMSTEYVRFGGVDQQGQPNEDPLIPGVDRLPDEGMRAGPGFMEHPDGPDSPNATEGKGVRMVITSRGQGYLVGDTINIGGGSEPGVIEVKTVAQGGVVESFETISQGFDIPVTNFFASGDFLTPGIMGNVTTTAGESTGTGFNAYFVNAAISKFKRTDEKPQIATTTQEIQLSLAADDTALQSGPWEASQGTREVNAQIAYPSPDGKYDLFFHFHNDITHTWAANWRGQREEMWKKEQFVGLSINPA